MEVCVKMCWVQDTYLCGVLSGKNMVDDKEMTCGVSIDGKEKVSGGRV